MAISTPQVRLNLPSQTPSPANTSDCQCLESIKTKVCDLIQSRWAVVAALGLVIALFVSPLMGGIAAGVGVLVAWEFTPITQTNVPLINTSKNPGTVVALQMNVLGNELDPHEFRGSCDPETDATNAEIEKLIVSPNAAKENIGQQPNQLEIQAEFKKGPTCIEVLPAELWTDIKQLAIANGYSKPELDSIEPFLKKYQHARLFRFFRHCPPFLSLDNNLRLHARDPKNNFRFDLPILNSPANMSSAPTAKLELAQKILTPLALSKTENLTEKMAKFWQKTPREEMTALLQGCLGANGEASAKDIECFESNVGQAVFYLLYQLQNQQMLQERPGLIEKSNKAKEVYAKTLGNSAARAQIAQAKVKAAGAELVFTQECDSHLARALHAIKFYNTDNQRSIDGSKIFLHEDSWEPGYISLPRLSNDTEKDQKATCIIATHKGSQKPFLLASLHGSAKQAKHARDLVTEVVELWKEMHRVNPGLQLMIGIDANTTQPDEERAFMQLLESLDLEATRVGITCAKERVVTVQHEKANKPDVSTKDYIIVPKGQIALTNQTVAFAPPPLNPSVRLPTINNPSDHAAIGAHAKILSMMAQNPQGGAFSTPGFELKA